MTKLGEPVVLHGRAQLEVYLSVIPVMTYWDRRGELMAAGSSGPRFNELMLAVVVRAFGDRPIGDS